MKRNESNQYESSYSFKYCSQFKGHSANKSRAEKNGFKKKTVLEKKPFFFVLSRLSVYSFVAGALREPNFDHEKKKVNRFMVFLGSCHERNI